MTNKVNSLNSIFYALGANFLIFCAKLIAAILTHSGSMMAESIHSLADCANQGLLLLGIHRSKRPPSMEHPLGYGKVVYFWSFIVALMLFSMGGMFSIYEGFHKLNHSEPLHFPFIAIVVLLFSIIIEGISFRKCIQEVNKERGTWSFKKWFHETRKSELLVVFGEDFAAIVGLLMALVFVLVSVITGNPVYDAFGSMSIGVLLICIAIFIGIEVKSLLIGQSIPDHDQRNIIEFLENQDTILKVFHFISLQLGQDIMIAVKVHMKESLSHQELLEAINYCEFQMKQKYPDIAWIFFEPDNQD